MVLLAWVAGVWWLQQASALPTGQGFAIAVGIAACVFVAGALRVIWVAGGTRSYAQPWGATSGRCRPGGKAALAGRGVDDRQAGGAASVNHGWPRWLAVAAFALSAGVGGYAWAAYRAEVRLGDSLPAALEGQDVLVTGVVAGLPITTGDGVRFVFDVERAHALARGDERIGGCDTCGAPSVCGNGKGIGDGGGAGASLAPRRLTGGGDLACGAVHVPKRIELVLPMRSAFGGKGGKRWKGEELGGRGVADLGAGDASEGAAAVAGTQLPRAGERWRMPVRLKAPRGFANWHGFDAELLALVRGIRASGYVRTSFGRGGQTNAVRSRRLHAGPLPGYGFAAWRERLRDDFRAALDPSARYGGVLMALALGERGDIADDDWQMFADTGVSHLLAISGLHVSLVAGAMAVIVGGLWRRASFGRRRLPLWLPAPKAAAVAGLLAAVAYGAIAGWGVPVRRAVGMVAMVVLALLTGRFAAPSYALAWALAVVVTLDPWAVVTPGLWLSFGAVTALVLAARRGDRARSNSSGRPDGARDAEGAEDADVRRKRGAATRLEAVAATPACETLVPKTGTLKIDEASSASAAWRALGWMGRWGVALCRRLAPAARAQYAVTIGLIPLTLAWFGSVPLLGPLANAVAIPVMTLIVTPLALASLMLPSGLAHWALFVAHAVVVWLADWLGTLAAMPWAVWRAPVAPVWAQMVAVVGVVVCLVPMPQWVRAARRWVIGMRLAGVALMGPAALASPQRPAMGEFRVTMLDIGQGNAVLVETATRTLLFDSGPPLGRGGDAGRRVIVPYLRSMGIARLDRMVVSHAHDDHFGGALSVLRAFPEAQVLSSLPEGHRVRRASATHRTCLAGQQWQWEGVTFRFLHPDKAALRDGRRGRAGPNSVSCVLRIANGRHSALLAADAESPQERTMVARYGRALRSDVLLAPHHGSLTSSSSAFVTAVSPAHVVFQTGYRNRFGHPKAAVVARYRSAGATLWQSVTHGGIRFSSTPDGMTAQAYRASYRRYWHALSPDSS
ncbi:DNA internalization-related competence protein ComEC/Rec2 [Pandoraea oxalativorans]|uniref:DNA internalization-related competence protein ComEC/Rec2 n=2 Tax=Pandoraea oxalativorans TaxID=573737 RepID=A0A192B1D9_9BURK|nr:DNA internalization-related competence protein ComEC/Rec2 [Pandoraea oxalativorans]